MPGINTPLEIVNLPNKGRSLVSSRPLKSGQIVLRDSPILLYPAFPDGDKIYCANCYREIEPNSTTKVSCTRNCSTHSIFCDQLCQSAAATTSHTPFVCRALTSLRTCNSPLKNPTDENHLQVHFLIAAYNLSLVSPSNFQILLSLQADSIVNHGADSIVNRSADQLHSLIASICSPQSYGFEFSLDLTVALLARDRINSFGLMEHFNMSTGDRSVRAYGIYPRAAFFNHDCLPNACRFDYLDRPGAGNTDFVVRMLHDVPEGREICLSYFPVNMKYWERQMRCETDYRFSCDCDRCKVEANWPESDEETGMEVDSEGEEIDFPHAYFFVNYMCNVENCGGTLAPLPPGDDGRTSSVMECSYCGNLSNSEGH